MVQRYYAISPMVKALPTDPVTERLMVSYSDYAALEKRCEELNFALGSILAVAIDDPILENNLQKTVFKLKAEKAELLQKVQELEAEIAELKEMSSKLEILAERVFHPSRYGGK